MVKIGHLWADGVVAPNGSAPIKEPGHDEEEKGADDFQGASGEIPNRTS